MSLRTPTKPSAPLAHIKSFRGKIPLDPAVPLLGICTHREFKAGTQKDKCVLVFVAALVIIPKGGRKQPTYSPTDE